MTATDAATATLERLLAQHGSRHTAAAVTSLLQGLAAAPADTDGHRWQALFADEHPETIAAIDALRRALAAVPAPALPPVAQRLAALRAEMAKRDIDGFFIPRADEFQGEYVPANAERLAWVSGFHGSAGCAIVLRDRAAFFTDGRYTIQALAEVDGESFTRYSTAENQPPLETLTPGEWLCRTLSRGQRFGIDAGLHTPLDVGRLNDALAGTGAALVLLDDNPLDAAWGPDRPPAPLAPVVPHGLEFSGVTSAEKRRQLAATLTGAQCAALVITLPEDICWLFNVRGGDVPCTPFALSYAIAHADGTADWFIDPRKLTPAAELWTADGIRQHPFEAFGDAVARLAASGARVWLDPAAAPIRVEKALTDGGASVHAARTPLSLMKACKNETEIAGARAAHHRDGVSVTRFLAALADQSAPARHDELSAAALLYGFRKDNPRFRGLSFETISGAGGNGAIVHYRASAATSKPLLAGPVYLVDSGAQYLDGTTDITRTLSVDNVDAEMRDRYTRVLKGHIGVSRCVFPEGTTGDALDRLARAPLQEIGLDYAHGTGHGVGSYLSVHEGPCSLSPRGTTVPLLPGMILSNEPGYYKEGAYGIRIENLVLVVDSGQTDGQGRKMLAFETLTLAPYDRALIAMELLTGEERQWIDAYHARVRAALLPDVKKIDPAAADYLVRATEPLA